MNIIEISGGLDEAKEILKSPLCIRSSHFNVKDKTYIARLHYIQTKPWRLVKTADPQDMVMIDEPNLEELINLDELSAAIVNKTFKPLAVECVVFNQSTGLLLSGIAGKGKASYFTCNCDDAMRTTVAEALDIIVKMKCSEEERENMKILTCS